MLETLNNVAENLSFGTAFYYASWNAGIDYLNEHMRLFVEGVKPGKEQ